MMIRREFESDEYEVWCFMVWRTWNLVCNLTHENGGGGEQVTEDRCWANWEVYQGARPTRGGADQLGVALGEKTWSKSKLGIFRVDVDATFNPEAGVYGEGVIIRDSEGKVVVAVARKTPPRENVMTAEAMAIVRGIVTCIEYETYPAVIYTDSLLAARIMANPGEKGELLPDDIAEIATTARDNFLLDVKHMYRSANRAAHSLAQFTSVSSGDCVWTSTYPVWLRAIVEEEE